MGKRRRYPAAVYLAGWRRDRIVKVGFSELRRWRHFQNVSAVLTVETEGFEEGYAFEARCQMAFRDAYPMAFSSSAQAVPYLRNQGGGYCECYRADFDEAVRHIAQLWAKHRDARHRDKHCDDCDAWHCTDVRTDVLREDVPESYRLVSGFITHG